MKKKRAINIPGENLKVAAQSNINVNFFFLTTYKVTSFEIPNMSQLISGVMYVLWGRKYLFLPVLFLLEALK